MKMEEQDKMEAEMLELQDKLVALREQFEADIAPKKEAMDTDLAILRVKFEDDAELLKSQYGVHADKAITDVDESWKYTVMSEQRVRILAQVDELLQEVKHYLAWVIPRPFNYEKKADGKIEVK